MARLGGGRSRRRSAEPFAGAGWEERVMAWWRARVVARVRKGECGTILSLHQDVQTYVRVMWDMLSSDKEEAAAPAKKKRPFCCWPPAMARSPCAATTAATAQW